jgi:hypothetical protein
MVERRNQNNVYHCSPTRRRTKGKIESKISATWELKKGRKGARRIAPPGVRTLVLRRAFLHNIFSAI